MIIPIAKKKKVLVYIRLWGRTRRRSLKLGFDDYDNYISMISVKLPTLEVLTTMQH